MSSVGEKIKQKIKQKVLTWVGSILPYVLMGIVIIALLGAVAAFCKWFFGLFAGPTKTEQLYSWAVASMDNADGQLLSLEEIENMPYKASALKAAFATELSTVDSNIYIMELYDENGDSVYAEYNLNGLTSNYCLPWQIQLAVCTANQYSDLDEFMEANAEASAGEEDGKLSEGFKYYVKERDINAVWSYMKTDIHYITNYSFMGILSTTDEAESVYGFFANNVSYEDYETKAVTDPNDTEGKLACVYKEQDGVGCYYPVAALDSVSTWLWNYDFNYTITLDDEGRPIEYELESVTKTSNIGGDDGLLADLEHMGISGSGITLFYYIADMFPYVSDNGYITGMKEAINYYNRYGQEWSIVLDGYNSDLAYKVVTPVYRYMDMQLVHDKGQEEHGILDITSDYEVEYRYDLHDEIYLKQENLWSRVEMVEYAMKYLGYVYYNAEWQEDGVKTGYIASSYYQPLKYSWLDNYKNIGSIIADDTAHQYEAQQMLEHTGYYNSGFLYGMTAWDFVYMILADTLYVDRYFLDNPRIAEAEKNAWGIFLEEQYLNNDGTPAANNRTNLFNSTSFYNFVLWCQDNGYMDTAYIINYDKTYGATNPESDIEHSLMYGDIGLCVEGYNENAKVTDIGIYVGYINGYPSFIHCSVSENSTLSYQGKVQISYLKSTAGDATYPDGGTVDYNCFVRVDRGSYSMEDGSGVSSYNDTEVWQQVLDEYKNGMSDDVFKSKLDDFNY